MSTVITKRKLEEAVSALDFGSPLPAKKPTAFSPPTQNQTNSPTSVRTPARQELANASVTTSFPSATSPYSLLASLTVFESVQLTAEPQSPESVKRAQFRPWDRQDFLQRLETYQISTWFGKPDSLNAAECTKRGWHNIGMDKLACRQCNAELNLRGIEESSASKYIELLNEAHKDTCPWKNRPCKDNIYTLPFVSSLATLSEYRERAEGLITMFRDANRVPKIKSELTWDEIIAITNALSASQSPSPTRPPTAPASPSMIPPSSPSPQIDADNASTESESETMLTSILNSDGTEFPVTRAACILALFGWQSASAIRGREMVKCGMCHRTVGLWMFERDHNDESMNGSQNSSPPSENVIASETNSSSPGRALDALHEHLSYCPWIKEPKNAKTSACSSISSSILCSNISPSLAVGTCGIAAEATGWKRTRTIVMRAVKNRGTSTVTNGGSDRQEPRSTPGTTRKTYDVLAEVRNILGPKRRKQD